MSIKERMEFYTRRCGKMQRRQAMQVLDALKDAFADERIRDVEPKRIIVVVFRWIAEGMWYDAQPSGEDYRTIEYGEPRRIVSSRLLVECHSIVDFHPVAGFPCTPYVGSSLTAVDPDGH